MVYADAQIVQGAWEEISEQMQALRGRTDLTLIIPAVKPVSPPEQPAVQANEKALAVLRRIATRQEGEAYTDGSDTLRMIREARDGGMYGL